MSPVLVCAGGGEGVWAEPGCSPLSPPQLCLCPGRVSAARNVKVAPRLQPPVPSSDTQYSRVLQFWPPIFTMFAEGKLLRCLIYWFTLYESNTGLCTQSLLLKLGTFPAKCQKFKPSLNIMNKVLFCWWRNKLWSIVNKDEHQCQNGRTPQYRHHSSWPQHCTHLISLLNILMAGINPIQDVYQTFYILAVSLF